MNSCMKGVKGINSSGEHNGFGHQENAMNSLTEKSNEFIRHGSTMNYCIRRVQ